MPENQPNKKPDKVTESIDYIFKMRHEGRMDEEEACLSVGAILSGELTEKDLEMFRFMYLFRKKDGFIDDASFEKDSKRPDSDESGVTIMIQIK